MAATALSALLNGIPGSPRHEGFGGAGKGVDLSTKGSKLLRGVSHHQTNLQLNKVLKERPGEVPKDIGSG